MKNLIISLLLLISFNSIFCQTKKVLVETPNPLTYTSFWGPVSSGNIKSAQIIAIVQAPILVKDNLGQLYKVSDFRINYSFSGSYKDESSGQVKSMKDLRVADFNNVNVLSSVWSESIKDNIKPGDKIIMNKIFFINKNGKMMIAPDLRITVY